MKDIFQRVGESHRDIFIYVDDALLNGAAQHSGMELHAALREFAANRSGPQPYPSRVPVQRRFEMMAQTTPCATAVTCKGRRLTYGELDAQADALAVHLQSVGLKPGSFCLVDLEPSLAQVRAVLAVLKAGAACLQFASGLAESACAAVLAIAQPAFRFSRDGALAGEGMREMRTIRCDEDSFDLPYGWPDEPRIDARTPACAFATVSISGELNITVRTHHALGACLDAANGVRPAPAGDADPVLLWRPLSSGDPLTIPWRIS
jgi:hypothetical protein